MLMYNKLNLFIEKLLLINNYLKIKILFRQNNDDYSKLI